jgi:hypothetical protein
VLRVTFIAILASTAGCGGALPEPAQIQQHERAYETVPYPPPAAFVELVPEATSNELVWVDGYWTWQGTRYLWVRGGWVKPPEGARYARWKVSFHSDGTIWMAPSAWYDARGHRMADPDILVPASTPPNELTSEDLQSGQ